ncbi:uncharacterized protein LOC143152495 isoform X2 [Ptiloglossa arizonensis]|uniref:uncharacterized protein LOC143152495 isoform X2 n=1 Tax=Ptiloglossa arizonensis TaxID=3350558 RepID=UPI003F9F09E7
MIMLDNSERVKEIDSLNLFKMKCKKTEHISTLKNVNVSTHEEQDQLKKIDQEQLNEQLLNNGITICEYSIFSCKFCVRKFPSLHDTLSHIKGWSHVNKLKRQNVNLNASKSKGTIYENSKMNTTNKKKVTKQNLGIAQEEEYFANDITETKYDTVRDTNKNNTNLQNYLYHCELCNTQIDINNLFEHSNTVTHKRNVSSNTIMKDNILYKCFCCKSIIQGSNLFINHLCLKTHVNNLARTFKNIEMNNNQILAPTSHNTQSISVTNIFVRKVEKCLIFIQLVDCENTHISYHCSFCRTKLNTCDDLIKHCQGKLHLWKVHQLFENINSNTKDVTFITNQVKKISFTDNNDNGLILSDDVCSEVIKYLHMSPFCSYNKTGNNETTKLKENLGKYLNKPYHEKYLEIEEKMYILSNKKMDQITLNLKFIMPHDKKDFLCLACEINISKELYTLYEHLCMESHIDNVNRIKKSKITKILLEEYMKQNSSKQIFCYCCKNNFPYHSKSISDHIFNQMHRRNHNKFYKIIDNTYKSILQDLNSLYYSILRFSCILCKTNFKYKIEFIEHIVTMHSENFENNIFNFCIPCATLWMYKQNCCYREHCNDIMHKYLVNRKDFMIEDLPECIKKLLTKVDETVNILFQETQVLLNDNIQEEVRQSIENSLRIDFPSVKAFLFGSRVTGLGFANSDIDIYIDCENTYYKSKTEVSKILDLICIEQVLRTQEGQWKVKEILKETRTPIIKLIYRRTGVECDISVQNGLSVENSKLLRLGNWGCATYIA